MDKILITGATGFIGGFIVDEALRQDMEVWVAVRKSSSRQWLTDERIRFIELNLSSQEQLEKQLEGLSFDYVVHAAGVTKCLNTEDFFRINTEGTKNLVRALIALEMPIRKFVYVSSLSVYGPVREQQPYEEIRESDTPRPNTAYGRSKLEAEQWLSTLLSHGEGSGVGFPYVILRPTGVYGPRERDYFLMAKSIKSHVDFAVGYKPQDITFVYVTDVVQAIFLALKRGETGRAYFLSDGEVYRSSTFSNLIRKELGNPWWIRITAPLWVLRLVTFFGEHISHITGKISALNNDKYNIMRQRNWRCDIQPAVNELGYRPKVKLEEGVRRTIKWYKDNKWL
ncbi:MAG: NAD(P)-dependent oxidoreductase [Prevotella sp.]|nr:NAD(P)-dependent oxidoreductase [Prevotella sp.]